MSFLNEIKRIIKEKDYISALLVLFMLAVLVSGAVCVFTYGTGIHAYDEPDFLEGSMWAEVSLNAGKIVSKTFYYPYIIPFGSNILCAPFVALFGTGLLANQLGMMLYYILYLSAIIMLAGSLYYDFRKRCILITVVSLFVYTYVGNNILHHLLYYGIAFVSVIGSLACVINILNDKNRKKNYAGLVLFCLWAASNGFTTAVLSNMTILLSVVVYLVFKDLTLHAVKEKKSLKLLATILVSTMIGIVANKLITVGAYDLGGNAARFTMVGTAEMIQHIVITLLNDYLRCFYISSDGVAIFSFNGILVLAQLAFAAGVLIAMAVLFNRNKKLFNDKEILVIIECILISCACLGEYVLTSSNERYLFNVILSLFFILAVCLIKERNKVLIAVSAFILAVFIGLFSLKNLYNFVSHQNQYKEKMEIIELLKDENLEYGFAKHANIWNVLSGNEIKSLPLNETNNGKVMNNTEISYYHASSMNADKFFVIMPDNKFDIYSQSDPEFLAKAEKEFLCNEYHILVFDMKYWGDIKEGGYKFD